MSRDLQRRQTDTAAIMRFEGSPRDPLAPRERSRWRRFVAIIAPYLVKKWELGERYLESEVRQREAAAQKDAEEAAEAAARAEETRVDTVKKKFDIIDQHFAKNPDLADGLKLLELQKLDPDLEEKLAQIQATIRALHKKHGTEIQIIAGELPAPGPESSGNSESE